MRQVNRWGFVGNRRVWFVGESPRTSMAVPCSVREERGLIGDDAQGCNGVSSKFRLSSVISYLVLSDSFCSDDAVVNKRCVTES